ncbi:acetyltransferase [Polaribacter uvawellassae]|uniref:acetyltransferase n=1 Tax=Polaribacter uvawellassae TaxID=3133495 RepID=UPI0032191119
MKKQLIIFGAGKIAEAVSYYFNRDSEYNIVAYVVDDVFITTENFLEKPLVKLSEIDKKYPATEFYAFVATGYQGINELRTTKYEFLKKLKYTFASYVSPYVKGDFKFGENTIIMDNAVIQPFANFGNNVFVWGGAMIGHHATIEDNCWLTGGCLIGGITKIGNSTFVGLGASIGNEINIGAECMIGAGTLTTKSLKDKSVLIKEPTAIHRLNATQFKRMSSCFRSL